SRLLPARTKVFPGHFSGTGPACRAWAVFFLTMSPPQKSRVPPPWLRTLILSALPPAREHLPDRRQAARCNPTPRGLQPSRAALPRREPAVNPPLLCLASCLLLASSARAADERLNILFCFADDWGRYASAYAAAEKHPSPNQVVKTPNIDRVAREGVLFRRAFVNAPSCTPCRSALLSGRYFFNTGRGAILQTARWDPAIPSFPLLLRDANYHIGKSYKVWSPGTPVDAPFGGQKHAYQKAGNLPNKFSTHVTRLVGEGTKLEEARRGCWPRCAAT